MSNEDLSDFSMLDLFRMEVETQTSLLNDNLLALETQTDSTEAFTALMRAAHSLKGAARIVQVEPAVKIAHVMEDCFVAAQQGNITLSSDQIDTLLHGVDVLLHLAQVPETNTEHWLLQQQADVEPVVAAISAILGHQGEGDQQKSLTDFQEKPSIQNSRSLQNSPSPNPPNSERQEESQSEESKPQSPPNRGVRVSGENLNRLMGLAGEALVEANWLQPYSDSLQKLRRYQDSLSKDLEKLQDLLTDLPANPRIESQIQATRQKANECYQLFTERLHELELFSRRSANLADRLYREAIATQMRPFADGVERFPRMVRDLAKQLGKQVKLEILGKSTQIDRDILEKLEAPLIHLLRNAIDHGIESPQERIDAGKSLEGTIRLEATHQAGMLSITVSDDGRGVELEKLRQKVVNQGRVSPQMAQQLTEAELIEFLFLPGFSTADSVTEISGRGVGLDVVYSMVQQVGGILRAVSQPSLGMRFHLQLPLTLSVIRALVVEIAGEAYAIALNRIEQLLLVPKSEIFVVENRQYVQYDEQNIGLVSAHQVFGLTKSPLEQTILPVIVISDKSGSMVTPVDNATYPLQPANGFTAQLPHNVNDNSPLTLQVNPRTSRSYRYGVVVDQFRVAQDLVVRPLDPRLGKVQDISAAAIREDGSIVLIVDVEDVVRSIDKLLAGQYLNQVGQTAVVRSVKPPLRILVVDDSITVREVERKLLENYGYKVDVAVNGMDAWNAIRTHHYDLVITDVDMPRMNGIELVSQMKQSPSMASLPVIIVSYKDREEDYIKGLEVGANYYLTKSSFHDDTLVNAVIDLIGKP